ncbi:MAG: hypothetical protein GXC72_06035 [Chitinophagaceae bacterium]|nr:hypothetical protein [Chitinophagaceae bacterium]
MGNLGAQELFIMLLLPALLFGLAYWLGKRSGYKQGQLDMYRRMEQEGRFKG